MEWGISLAQAIDKTPGRVGDGTIFSRFLFLLTCASMLTAVLAIGVYALTGAGVHAKRIADELLPRARSMARLASRLQTGQLSYDAFIDFSIKGQQGTRVYIFDDDAKLVAYTADPYNMAVSDSIRRSGRQIVETGRETVSTRWRSADGIVVGVAITDNLERVTGAVVMSRPTVEVYASMLGFIRALALSCLIAAVFMVAPAYLASRRMSNPILSMMRASVAMAGGDFSVHADESRDDELGQLGAALNHLSGRLRANISDLVLARNRLHVILDGLGEGVVALGAGGDLLYGNPAALALFGAADDGALLTALAPAQSLCEAALSGAGTQSAVIAHGERKLHLTVSVSQETSDMAPGTVIVVQDVTASERLEQTRRDYVANVSHELRTPISSIRSLAETLEDGLVKTEEDRSRYYGYILRESLRLSRLIDDLLELSRLQSGAAAPGKSAFDLCAVVGEVAEQMRIAASYSGIRIKTALTCDAALVAHSNRDRVEQVLVALLDNAIKFASDEGTIVVDVSRAGDGARAIVSVKNTGHIEEKHLPHLFERFYKADAAHSAGGTGLGLAIVQEVLHQLGESIEAANEGEYAVFRFTLALEPDEGAPR